MALLDIRHLTIEIDTPQGFVKAVDNISLTINTGEIRGLVGESGSGKSLIAKAIIGICKDTWKVTADRMRLDNVNLLLLTPEQRRKLISRDIAMIFQEPLSCLDPSRHVKHQLAYSIPSYTYTGKWWKRLFWRKKRSIALLHKVGIKNHKQIMRSYPHELTDCDCQKVIIAMAIAVQPKILIADEPTNELDPITQSQILRLLRQMNQVNKTTIILIGHNLTMITKWASHITVMYCGQSVESAETHKILTQPKHPYTVTLLNTLPDQSIAHKSKLKTLPGTMPSLQNLPIGCRLGPRCPYAQKECVNIPYNQKIKDHKFNCHFPLNLDHNG